MKAWRTDPNCMVRLDRGEDLIPSLLQFAEEYKITAGSIQGIGAVGPVELAYYDFSKKEYQTKNFDGEYELLSLIGNFSMKDNKPQAHIHVVLADRDFKAFGGHLMGATVAVTAEIIVSPDVYQMDRGMDDAIGLATWSGCKVCEI